MRRIKATLCLLFLSVLLFQCQKELAYEGDPDPVPEVITPEPITAALQGNIFDETGAPAAGVTVQVGGKTFVTNANGYFRINDASLDKKASLVVATKAGYFKALRTFSATSGANQVTIKLIKKVLAGTIDATAGGEVSLSNGSKVLLPANGVVNAVTTAAYTGTVNVYATYIDPSSSDIDQTVPGSFMANNKDGKRVLLNSYGMLAVELESASGEKLQIKTGSVAKLMTAIPASAQATAPTSISLWYVDETTGLWKEEGTAAKNGNVYVGDVKHFTYWNCDLQVPVITFAATFKTPDGQPLVNASITIKPATGNYYGYAHGYTDSLGQATGPIPANMNLVLEVHQYGQGGCNNAVIYSQNIGPFSQATDLGVITVNSPNNDIITIKGKLFNCSNAPVTNGYAVVNFGYYTHYASVNATGDFQTTFTRCNNSTADFSVVGVDVATQQQSTTATTIALVTPITTAGNISACGASSAQFINYTLDGTSFNIGSQADTFDGTSQPIQGVGGAREIVTYIDGFKAGTSNFISIEFVSTNETSGSYPITDIGVNIQDTLNVSVGLNVSVTNFPTSSAGFYEGSFGGQFRDGLNMLHTLSGTFRVRRR